MAALQVISLVIAPFASNCYIAHRRDHREAVIIDPGGEATRIQSVLEQSNLKPTDILLTHGHIDHIMGIAELRKAYGLPVHAHRAEGQLLQAAPMQAQMFGLPPVAAPEVDHWFDHEDVLNLAGIEFSVIHTPGHSPGGCCFRVEDVLFSGDTLFEASIGRTDLPGGDAAELIGSIKAKLLVLPEELQVYPGHGDTTTIGREKQANPFLQGGHVFGP